VISTHLVKFATMLHLDCCPYRLPLHSHLFHVVALNWHPFLDFKQIGPGPIRRCGRRPRRRRACGGISSAERAHYHRHRSGPVRSPGIPSRAPREKLVPFLLARAPRGALLAALCAGRGSAAETGGVARLLQRRNVRARFHVHTR